MHVKWFGPDSLGNGTLVFCSKIAVKNLTETLRGLWTEGAGALWICNFTQWAAAGGGRCSRWVLSAEAARLKEGGGWGPGRCTWGEGAWVLALETHPVTFQAVHCAPSRNHWFSGSTDAGPDALSSLPENFKSIKQHDGYSVEFPLLVGQISHFPHHPQSPRIKTSVISAVPFYSPLGPRHFPGNLAGSLGFGKGTDKANGVILTVFPYISLLSLLNSVCMLSHSVVAHSLWPHSWCLPDASVHGFSRQEYWSGLPFPSPGNLPDPEVELTSPLGLTAGGFFTHWVTGDAPC